MKKFLVLLFFFFAFANVTLERKKELYQASIKINTYRELENEGIISSKIFQQLQSKILDNLKLKSPSELSKIDNFEEIESTSSPNTGVFAKAIGFFTFVSVIWVVAIFIVVDLLNSIPPIVKEVLAWFLCFLFIFGASRFEAHISPYIAFTGCLGIIGALQLLHFYHKKYELKNNVKLAVLLIIWTPTAIYYDSKLIGFTSSIVLEALLGFTVAVKPFCYTLGFEDHDVMVRAGGSSLIMIILNVILDLKSKSIKIYEPFRSGMLFMGTFVYFLSLLIVSNYYYSARSSYTYYNNYSDGFTSKYIYTNILAIVSGVAALFFGSIYPNLGYLQGVGGTFFMLILLSKYTELNWKGTRGAWGLLGLGGILYGMALFINTYPKYFIFNF